MLSRHDAPWDLRYSGAWLAVLGAFAGGVIWASFWGAVWGLCAGFLADFWLMRVFIPALYAREWQQILAALIIHMCAAFSKLDGSVSRKEIKIFRSFVMFRPMDEVAIGQLFNVYRKSNYTIEHIAHQIYIHCHEEKPFVFQVLARLLYAIVKEEGSTKQLHAARTCMDIWGITPEVVYHLEQEAGVDSTSFGRRRYEDEQQERHTYRPSDDAPFVSDAYKTLGVKPTAKLEDVKKRYRMLVRQHHPDKLRGKGGSPKAIKKAEEKIAAYNVAYQDLLKRLK